MVEEEVPVKQTRKKNQSEKPGVSFAAGTKGKKKTA